VDAGREDQPSFEAHSTEAAHAFDTAVEFDVTRDVETLLAQVQRAYERQSVLIRGIGHDFKSPIASIVRLSESLAAGEFGELDESQAQACRLIEQSARHLMAVAQALYAVGDARQEVVGAADRDVDVCEVLERIADVNESVARAKSIDLHVETGSSPALVRTSAGVVERVLGNIVDNAVKFTSDGSVTVTCALTDDVVEVAVADTGIGIPPDEVGVIGTEFARGSNATEYDGSGVGLAVARHLLEGMGGTLDVESTFGEGSRFTVRIPAAPMTTQEPGASAGDE
jgi:hypothetical protein